MARAGELPTAFGRVSRRGRTPWAATLLVTAIAVLLLPLGSVAIVASVSSFASLVAFAAVNVALGILRARAPGLHRPFRVPLTIGRTPVLPVVGAVSALLLIAQLAPEVIAAGCGLAVVILAVYGLLHIARRRAGRSSVVE
jgi:amino acid transporter